MPATLHSVNMPHQHHLLTPPIAHFIVNPADDLQFFEEWTPPAHSTSFRARHLRRGGKKNIRRTRNGAGKKKRAGGKKNRGRGGNKKTRPTTSIVTFPAYLPNMERLRTQGLQMLQAYTASPKCGTSRYSTLTGRYPSRSSYSRFENKATDLAKVTIPTTKLYDMDEVTDGYDCSEHNLAATLKKHGYRTGVTGKWHLSPSKTEDGLLTEYSQVQNEVRSCGFDFAEAIYPENLQSAWNKGDISHNMEYVTYRAIEFINQSDEPFFLYLNPTVPHGGGSVYDVLNGSHDCTNTPEGKVDEFLVPAMMGSNDSCQDYRKSVLARSPDSTSNNDLGAIWIDDSIGACVKVFFPKY